MKLKSFGCSFIHGSDLSDCPHTTDRNNLRPSDLSWPALIAKKYAMEYQCYARPASGNLQILETLLSNILHQEKDLYVIGWSWIDRLSYFSEKNVSKNHPWNPLGWTSILPCDDDLVSEIYYRHIHSQLRDKLESLIYIKTAIDELLRNDQKFIMTCIDDLIWETEWHVTPAITNLQKYIRPYITDFQGKNFLDWSRDQGFKLSDNWHPLDSAHSAAADYILPSVEKVLQER